MKTAISLPDELFGAADRTARRLGVTRSELFRRALISFLQRHDEREVTQALNRVYGDHEGVAAVPAALREMQALSVPPDEW
jgi:metal-responsive CopG/Arc/MetJ family transcriptional regulator